LSSANLGSIAMPYNPTATPAPKTATPAAATMAALDRYGSGSASTAMTPTSTLPNYGQAPDDAADAKGAGSTVASATMADASRATTGYAERYGAAVADAEPTVNNAESSAATSAGAATLAGTTPVAPYIPARYGQTTAAPATSPTKTVETATNVATASAQTYRPGGTSSYPGTAVAAAPVQVATRPAASAAPASNSEAGSVPNVAVPATSSATTQPTTPRYW
jgi:hypothetical protein